MTKRLAVFAAIGVEAIVGLASAKAQSTNSNYALQFNNDNALSLAQATPEKKMAEPAPAAKSASTSYGYKGVSDFFNIREANPTTKNCEWQLEVPMAWSTSSNGTDDDWYIGTVALRYGVSDDAYLQVGVLPMNIGDGADYGNGDLQLLGFWRFIEESDSMPAMALWSSVRLPSGQGSSGVDADVHLNLTKQVATKCRAHIEGYIRSANGDRGKPDADFDDNSNNSFFGAGSNNNDDQYDRRHFQWGIGPGFDYNCCEAVTVVVNYLNRSSEYNGYHNENLLEVGAHYQIMPNQALKFAVDIGLDGNDVTPNFITKALWAISF